MAPQPIYHKWPAPETSTKDQPAQSKASLVMCLEDLAWPGKAKVVAGLLIDDQI